MCLLAMIKRSMTGCIRVKKEMVSIPFTQLLQAPQSAGHVWHVQLLLCQKLLGSLVHASSSGEVAQLDLPLLHKGLKLFFTMI